MSGKILIVDDEKDTVQMLTLILKKDGYQVLAAYDGMQAVMLAHKENPDLIILDIMMPAGSGYYVCDRLKLAAVTANIPVIILSARAGQDTEEKAKSAGARYFFKKPFDSEELMRAVKEILK